MKPLSDYERQVATLNEGLYERIKRAVRWLPDIRDFKSETARSSVAPWTVELKWRYIYDELLTMNSAESRKDYTTLQLTSWLSTTSLDDFERLESLKSASFMRISGDPFVFITYPAITLLLLKVSSLMMEYTVLSGNLNNVFPVEMEGEEERRSDGVPRNISNHSHAERLVHCSKIVLTPRIASSLLVYSRDAVTLRRLLEIAHKTLDGERIGLVRRALTIGNKSLLQFLLPVDCKFVGKELIYAAKKANTVHFRLLMPYASKNDRNIALMSPFVLSHEDLVRDLLIDYIPPQFVMNTAMRILVKGKSLATFNLFIALPQMDSAEYALLPLLLEGGNEDFLRVFLSSNIRCTAIGLTTTISNMQNANPLTIELLNANMGLFDIDSAMDFIIYCSRRPHTLPYARLMYEKHSDVLDRETVYRFLSVSDGV